MRVLNPCRIIRRLRRRERWRLVLSRGYPVCRVIKRYLALITASSASTQSVLSFRKYVIEFPNRKRRIAINRVAPGLSRINKVLCCRRSRRINWDRGERRDPKSVTFAQPVFPQFTIETRSSRGLSSETTFASGIETRTEPVSTTGRLLRIVRSSRGWLATGPKFKLHPRIESLTRAGARPPSSRRREFQPGVTMMPPADGKLECALPREFEEGASRDTCKSPRRNSSLASRFIARIRTRNAETRIRETRWRFAPSFLRRDIFIGL